MRSISRAEMERIKANLRQDHGLGALDVNGQLNPSASGFASDDQVFNDRHGGGGATWRGFDIVQNSVSQPPTLQTGDGPQSIPPVIAYAPPYVNHNRTTGNVIAGGTASTQVLPQNNLRTMLIIQNTSATIDLLFNFGSNASSGTFLRIPAGASLANAWVFDNDVVPRDQLFVAFSAAGGTGYYLESSWAL